MQKYFSTAVTACSCLLLQSSSSQEIELHANVQLEPAVTQEITQIIQQNVAEIIRASEFIQREHHLQNPGQVTMAACAVQEPLTGRQHPSFATIVGGEIKGENLEQRVDPASTFKMVPLAVLGTYMQQHDLSLNDPISPAAQEAVKGYPWAKTLHNLPQPTYGDVTALVYNSDNSVTEFLAREILPNAPDATELKEESYFKTRSPDYRLAMDNMVSYLQNKDIPMENSCFLSLNGMPNGIDGDPNPFNLSLRTNQTTVKDMVLVLNAIREDLEPLKPVLTADQWQLSDGTQILLSNRHIIDESTIYKTGTTNLTQGVGGFIKEDPFIYLGADARPSSTEQIMNDILSYAQER